MVVHRGKPHQSQTHPKPDQTSSSLNHTTNQNRSSGSQNRSYEIGAGKSERVCTHCGETEHTKSRCYESIGNPEWWDPAKAPRK